MHFFVVIFCFLPLLSSRALDEDLQRITTPELPSFVVDSFNDTRRSHGNSSSEDNSAGTSEDSQEIGANQKSDEDGDDTSDVSEEKNPYQPQQPIMPAVETIITSHINQSFVSKKSFACPRVKPDLLTGTFLGDLSPEDIRFIASMGDGVASGVGLFERNMQVEFRGASFASGGDANMDGLITIPNILREFNPDLLGVSHGMGPVNNLPKQQLSVAFKGATTKDLPAQVKTLLSHLDSYQMVSYRTEWVMIIIAIGTEEICASCSAPHAKELYEAMELLQSTLPKALVVLLGPTHVSHPHQPTKNMLKYRCNCSMSQPPGFMESVADKWISEFKKLQVDHNMKMRQIKQTFGLLALPQLTITSRTPDLLFHPNTPILSRRGHMYMSKWLWNRLMTGERYNISSAVLSSDSYFCPSSGCPYFRTTANMHHCEMLPLADASKLRLAMAEEGVVVKKRRSPKTLYSIAIAVTVISFFVALTVGIIMYQLSKRSMKGRYEDPEPVFADPPPKVSDTVGHGQLTRQNAFNRQSTRHLDTSPVIAKASRAESAKLLLPPSSSHSALK